MTPFARSLLPSILASLIILAPALTQGREDLSGTWDEKYSETTYAVEQWSTACGPTPRSTGRRNRGRQFQIEDRGIELKFSSPQSNFSTAHCLTANKQVRPKERNVKDKLLMLTCSTAEDAPKYENGFYSFRIKSATRIEYKETTRFSRNESGSMCVHTRRVRRLYLKKKEAPVSEATKPAPDAGTPNPPAVPEDPCAKPGPAVSIQLEPDRARLKPGDRVCIQVSVSDKNACELKSALTWAKKSRLSGIRLNDQGCLEIAKGTKAQKRSLKLKANGLTAGFQLTVLATRRPLKSSPPAGPAHAPDQPPNDPSGPEVQDPPADQPPEPTPSTEPKPVAADVPPQPETQPEQEPAQEPPPPGGSKIPTWVLPAAAGGGLLLLALVVLLMVARKRRAGSSVAAKPEPLPSTTSNWSLGAAGTLEDAQPGPGPSPESPPPTSPTRVEPLRAFSGPLAQGDAVPEDLVPTIPPDPEDQIPTAPPPSDDSDHSEEHRTAEDLLTTQAPSPDEGEGKQDPDEVSGFCTECGGPLSPGTEFCTTCGARVASEALAISQPEEPESEPEKEPAPHCTNCGQELPSGAHFCPFCQTKQERP